MQLEKLQLDLRPRPNRQALDLGYALLRLDAWNVYASFLALWLPWGLSLMLLAIWLPQYSVWLLILMWWPLPLFERAPLYVLGHLVFDEKLSWRQALRAWPGQLRGGSLGMLTIGRLNCARGLYHAVWQLEQARGKLARDRKNLLGRAGTAGSAFWHGYVCAHFVMILQIGMLGLISFFSFDSDIINPFLLLMDMSRHEYGTLDVILSFGSYMLAVAVIAPVYVACSFTLYLNRRATIEAWDLSIALRQINPPRGTGTGTGTTRAGHLGMLLCVAALCWGQSNEVQAKVVDEPARLEMCTPPASLKGLLEPDQSESSARQRELHAQIRELLKKDELSPYKCKEVPITEAKERSSRKSEKDSKFPTIDAMLGELFKVLLIAALIIAICWLLYHYRDNLSQFFKQSAHTAAASEVGGLDIRPNSLPKDVAGRVRSLWQEGQHRAALALLYRATISRLVQQNAMFVARGTTEGDFLQLVEKAWQQGEVNQARSDLIRACTEIWRAAAYGERWPQEETVLHQCAIWQAEFGSGDGEDLL